MMIYLPALVSFLLVLTAEGKVGNSSESPFCFETAQCLLFKLKCETEDYEVRHYESDKWVSADEKSYVMEIAVINAFRRLYDYIAGANEGGKKIEMTAPVIVKMVDQRFFSWGQKKFTVSFLLPAEHQKNAPKPTDPEVYIHDLPAMTVYVKSYGWWMASLSHKATANRLSAALKSVKAKYIKDFSYAVGYNSPMTLFNRHNEVWFVAEDEPLCSSED